MAEQKKNIKAIFDMCRRITSDIKDQFSEDENAKIDDSTLSTLKDAFEDILNFEKTFLIVAQDTFYGSMLMNMDTEVDFSQRGPVDLHVDKEPFVMSFNPIYVCDYTYPEFTGLVVSEILRLAYDHPAAYGTLNHEKDHEKHEFLEKASSASISNMVKSDIRLDNRGNGLRLPHGAYTTSSLNHECGVTPKQDQSINYYYKILERFAPKTNNDGEGNDGSMLGDGDKSSQSNNQSGKAVASPNNSNGHSTHDWEHSDPDETTDRIKSMVKNVYDSMSEKQKDNMPAGLQEQLSKLFAPPEINWKQLLRKYIGSIPQPYRQTRTRLNRRQPYRADLSGRLPKRVVNIVCVFDTSGSMSSRDLTYCMNEVFNIVNDRDGAKITIIECDAEVNKVYEVKNIKDVQTKMSGRGGTSFVPAINYINGENSSAAKQWPKYSGKFRDAVMIYFTDGYGDCEIPKPRTYRNLWVVLGSVNNLSLKQPYGEVKSLSMDKDWIKNVKDDQW